MEAKTFQSRLFKRKINPDNPDFWAMLYAEILFRIRQLEDLNCLCHFCRDDLKKYNYIIDDMVSGKHIQANDKPINFTGERPCSRIEKEDQLQRAELYEKNKPR